MSEPLTLDDVVERVNVLSLRPGDTLVLTVPVPISAAEAARVKETIRSQLTVDAPVLIVPAGAEFTIVRPDQP